VAAAGDGGTRLRAVTLVENRARVWGWVAARADGRPVSVRVVCDTAAVRLGVDGVGVSVARHPGQEPWCASDVLSARVEELQVTVGECPGAEVVAGGGPVLIGDLDSLQNLARWPGFAPAAVAAGARAVFAFPLRVGVIRVGVFTCYHSQPRVLSGDQLAQCLLFAELALQLVLADQDGWPASDG
jgi:GAF domain-containing protein